MKPSAVCRCCLSEACYKHISNQYFHSGKLEVYSEMLFDTFNINISYQNQGKGYICEDCIVKLRQATQFKQQVEQAEDILVKMLSNGSDDAKQIPKIEMDDLDDLIDHISDDFEDDSGDELQDHWEAYDEIVGNDDEGEMFTIKLEPKAEIQLKIARKDEKCSKRETVPTQSPAGDLDDGFEDICKMMTKSKAVKTKKEKSISKDPKVRTRTRISKMPQTQVEMRQNSFKLITNSNLCLFDSLKTKFGCFYCKNSFMNMSELREHSVTHSNQLVVRKCINRLQGMAFKNVDITSLACTLCNQALSSLNELMTHLTDQHNIEFQSDKHMLIPYRLENGFSCVLCSETFNTYYRLSIHMNTHYRNHVCEICGLSYINRLSLRMHVHSVHRPKKCVKCSATFLTSYLRVKHMRKEHNSYNTKRYCLLCNKTFPYTYMLDEHKIKEHGLKREVCSCLDCGKTFAKAANLRVHVRSVHVKERNHPCQFCGLSFFTSCDRKRHERTHEDVRSFACSYCEGRFKSKDSLRRHLKRQHGHLFVANESI